MCFLTKYVFLLFIIISECYALTCRSEHGTQEEEIKKVFNKCKKQLDSNSSDSGEDPRNSDYNQRNQWQNGNRENRNENKNNGMGNRNRVGSRDSYDDSGNVRYDKVLNRNGGRDDVAHRMDDRQNTMDYNRNEGSNRNGYNNNSGKNRNIMNDYDRNDQISGRDEFLHSEELSGDMARLQPQQQHNNYYTPQPSRRYKREKRIEMNSGQRSQYNPHSQRSNDSEYNNSRNSSGNTSKEMNRACVLHCVFENLHLTDDDGVPDRYLLTHSFTMNRKNEDVRDFIQESIEECYQLADNENTEDKCEFSKNLMTCLVEKERANCDDYKELNSYILE